MTAFPTWAAGPIPQLVAALTDRARRSVLTFTWPAAAGEGGLTFDHYLATLWADAERTQTLPGGAPAESSIPQISFSGVPKGAAYLLDVSAVAATGEVSAPISLMQVSPFVPGEAIGAVPQTADITYPDGETVEGLTMPLRPVYGTYGGVKRWARVVTFGPGVDQVGPLDVEYFLMAASDEIDAALAGKFSVPLSPVEYGTGVVRYPPPVPTQCERLAAAMLLASRRSILTESQSSYASYLESSAADKIAALADAGYIEGQSMASGYAPQVYNAAPRQFTLRGDPAGRVWNPVTGSSDLGTFQPRSLPFAGVTWRYGGGYR